jgi:hypothetical protein
MQYLGTTRGPVEVKFSDEVVFKLKEVRVFSYPEPILLIGTDLLGFSPYTNHTFSYIGINPVTATGEIVFYDRKK